MKQLLKSTTALVLSGALVLPHAALAQGEASIELEQQEQAQENQQNQAEKQAQQKAERKEQRKAERKEQRKAERQAQKEAEAAAQVQADASATQQPASGTADTQASQQTTAQTQQPIEGRIDNSDLNSSNAYLDAQEQTQQQATQQQTTQQQTTQQQATGTQTVDEQTQAQQRADRKERREKRAARQAAREERQAQQDAEAAAAAANAQSAEVTEQTIDQNDVRSSDQEFATQAVEDDDDSTKDLLKTLGKGALAGLGVYAVGKLLDNGDRVVSNSGDRVVVQTDDGYRVLRDDDVLLRQPGSNVRTEQFTDGSTRSYVTREDGSQVVTVRAADGRVLRRTRVMPNGQEYLLFDDTQPVQTVQVNTLPTYSTNTLQYNNSSNQDDLRRALQATQAQDVGRKFSLSQIRNIDAVRYLVPEIEVDNVNFATGSSAIDRTQAQELANLGGVIRDSISSNPNDVFLIEGHTDAVGTAEMNLALSDRRAETVALALTEYFNVPPENLVIQGYGEYDLKVPTDNAEQENRRVAVRRITPLLNR